MSEAMQSYSLQKFSAKNTPFNDKIKPIKKNGSATKKDQLLADRDAYLQLLLAQLKNQNPQNPADTNQMTQNIVSISQAEQAITTNEYLEQLVNMQMDNHRAQAVSYIGKEVEFDNAYQELEFGEANFTYSLPEDVDRMKVKILDKSGFAVRTMAMDSDMRKAGNHELRWDGRNDRGEKVNEGKYSIRIEAYNQNGSPVTASTAIKSIVEGVMDNQGHQELILANKRKVKLGDIQSIYLPKMEANNNEKSKNIGLNLDQLINQLPITE